MPGGGADGDSVGQAVRRGELRALIRASRSRYLLIAATHVLSQGMVSRPASFPLGRVNVDDCREVLALWINLDRPERILCRGHLIVSLMINGLRDTLRDALLASVETA